MICRVAQDLTPHDDGFGLLGRPDILCETHQYLISGHDLGIDLLVEHLVLQEGRSLSHFWVRSQELGHSHIRTLVCEACQPVGTWPRFTQGVLLGDDFPLAIR